jgi:hypothetical protein
MTHTEFNDEKNLRCVDRCCASCAHGDDTYGCATCLHPDRDGPISVLSYQVCDCWKASAR